MSNDTFLQSALAYAARGWRIHPLKTKGKKPLLRDWPKRATTDEQTILQWWGEWPDANIGLATGKGSGVFVIDIDGAEGDRSWTQLISEVPEIPEDTLTSQTGGGRHLFFTYPPRREVGNRVAFRPGLDVRGDGGYVVVPPSLHPSGRPYRWPFVDSLDDLILGSKRDTRIATAPVKLLNVIAPPRASEKAGVPAKRARTRFPWEQPEPKTEPAVPIAPSPRPPARPHETPILKRAALYLRECESAVQGAGGHNALLWAARAMVIGFELSDVDALALLWSDFNPRCSPPWDRSSPADVHDFERKVTEARNTPGEKPSGWLLDQYGLRSEDEALQAFGARLATGLLAGHERKTRTAPAVVAAGDTHEAATGEHHGPTQSAIDEPAGLPERCEFPLHCFPPAIRYYIETVADVQVVDPAAVALSVLVTAGAAMGNAFWYRIKRGHEVPPVLWGVVIARSGSNKSGPFREVIKPLRMPVPMDRIENPMLNPQGQLIIEDATTESVIDVLSRSHRGLCLANGELAGWVGSFDRYVKGGSKKNGGDESVWLKLWDGDSYHKNRKTDQECVFIERAAVSVIGCIQPRKMAECFDPSRFASGLVPRLLIVEIPPVRRKWSEREMSDADYAIWSNAVEFLRTRPFASLDSNTGQYVPNILMPGMAAKELYISHWEAMAQRAHEADEWVAMFASKGQGMAGRLALVLHGLGAAEDRHDIMSKIDEQTMCGGIELARYFLNEQLRMYGLGTGQFRERRGGDVLEWILTKKPGSPGRTTAQEYYQSHKKRYTSSRDAKRELDALVKQGKLTREKRFYVLP